MNYIIKIIDDENKIRYYKGIKKNPHVPFACLADWSLDFSEARVFKSKDCAINEAYSLNEIAVVVTTQVIEISCDKKENCILRLEASENKKKTIRLLDEYLEKHEISKADIED